MGRERHVKLFRNGRNQAVRIPREFELPGKDAVIRNQGKKLVIEPRPVKRSLHDEGGILRALRRSPLVGANLDLSRPKTAGRRIEI